MMLLRTLAALSLLAGVASAQIGTPPTCDGAVTDREVFRTQGGRVKFHLRFHASAGVFDARAVVKLPHGGTTDPSCTEGNALDFVIDELVRERHQFLP